MTKTKMAMGLKERREMEVRCLGTTVLNGKVAASGWQRSLSFYDSSDWVRASMDHKQKLPGSASGLAGLAGLKRDRKSEAMTKTEVGEVRPDFRSNALSSVVTPLPSDK